MKTTQTTVPRTGAKWLPGAMALAATTAGSQAATVQITLSGNKISTLGGNILNADVTGDGTIDLAVFAFVDGVNAVVAVINGVTETVGFNNISYRRMRGYVYSVGFNAGVIGTGILYGATPLSASSLLPVIFADTRINAGVATDGWLEVLGFNESTTSHTLQLTRLIFDDAGVTRPGFTSIPGVQAEWVPAAIPEPSSFALLGLGAAGLLARRRRQAT
jgi:hypothetical protein